MQCDDRLVIQDLSVQDSILTQECDSNRLEILGLIYSQKVELNYQTEDRIHIHIQVQFHENDNLSNCQYGSQNFDFSQVQMGMMKLDLGFQNNMILGPDK